MSCCPQNIIPFAGQSITTIPYTGVKPLVSVVYFVDGQWKAIGVGTEIRFTGSNIVINHGGPATGRVVIK
jgi:hypothetical protein